jgi:hypothetical protein
MPFSESELVKWQRVADLRVLFIAFEAFAFYL